MKNSTERINFITDYISDYEKKIKLLNSNGLFDAAKLFELFAVEVSRLYTGKKFKNLNEIKTNFDYVDLISEDSETYIQVTTRADIPTKIRQTLKKIKGSEKEFFKKIKSVKFFVLNNESVDKITDISGNEQIGNIPFIKSSDLITTSDIIKKSISDLDFQIELYNLFKKESESIKANSTFLQEAIINSKNIGLNNIECKINNEYEIDRSKLIEQIRLENHKNISIQGNAGSGKSVLCKNLVNGVEILIYARAEQFLEVANINDIWGFNVRETLEFLNDEPIVFFIDALEFIADTRTKLDLLSALYECTKDYPEAKIITSCRTCDKGAFLKIEGNYSVYTYEVSDLTIAEQFLIAEKYPIIKKMSDMNSYRELLKSPLYINLIITKITNIDNILDENQLREHIWQHIICLNDNEIKKIVESIALTRAKKFSLGANSADYDTKIISKLLSENILVQNKNTVRLKYDVFEDICFEQYLDNEFDNSKGKYDIFFKEIEKLDRCVYRRYQIWISNKMLAKTNRDKFLYELIFSAKMPLFWRKQTEIGLVKSRHCSQFFNENGDAIIKFNLLKDFIKTTNLYAFEIQKNSFFEFPLLQLRPSGEGRRSLIHLLTTSKLYENEGVSYFDLEKLCSDYAKEQSKDKQTAEEACGILIHIIEHYISESQTKDLYNLSDILNNLLKSIYQMAEYSNEWIRDFWDRITLLYKSGNRVEKRLAEDIIKDTIKFKHAQLAISLPSDLCKLAEMYWTYSPKSKPEDNYFGFNQRDRYDRFYQYGLSEKAEYYEHGYTRKTAINSNFFYYLFKRNFWKGLDWTIEFVNSAVSNLSSQSKNGLPIYEIYFVDKCIKKEYLGFNEMWLTTTKEHSTPLVISDLIYCLKEELRYIIKNDAVRDKKTIEFANNVKNLIYDKSNNIALLTVISDIGMEFFKTLPGFSLDLATNIDIILLDLSRYALIVKNPVKEMLEKQIWMTMNIPYPMLKRYSVEDLNLYNIKTYVIESQIYLEEKIKEKCYKILDYLYSIIPNNKEYKTEYLQIQHMDLRTADIVKVNESTIALIPTVNDETENITEKIHEAMLPENDTTTLLEIRDKITTNNFELKDCLNAIEVVLDEINNNAIPTVYENILIGLFCIALKNENLDVQKREQFCQIWIDGIRKYFSNGSFIFEYNTSWVLFAQIESDISEGIKNQIKLLILDLILYRGQNGILLDISQFAKQYLLTNPSLSLAIFNTIVKLSEDEMNHQKFNADYLKNNRQEDNDNEYEFRPNMEPKLFGINKWIEEARKNDETISTYIFKKDEIINTYLLEGKELELSDFNINNFDINLLLRAINCGIRLINETIIDITKKIIICMIDIWEKNKNYTSHKILDTYSLYEIMSFLQRELLASEENAKIVIDILFQNIDFKKFTNETTEFYHDVFGCLLAEYFDSHSDKSTRKKCEVIAHLLEERIETISEGLLKKELYKSLILSPMRYAGSGDWSKLPSGYSYQDKQFLNEMFSKYGGFHLKNMLNVLYKLHIDKLLPEILLSVRDAFKNSLRENNGKWRAELFIDIIKEKKTIVLLLITRAFLDFNAEIKQDSDLTNAFEDILEMLIEINYEEAAIILDEFRIH